MKIWPALIGGILFGLGLTLSGMSDPAKVLGFLNITGDWVPDLILVMGGAVIITVIVTPLVVKRPQPLFADDFSLPNKQTLDMRLIGGAVLFGVGWGLSGYCPGPAVVSLLYGYESTIVFCLAMLAGMSIEGLFLKRLGKKHRN